MVHAPGGLDEARRVAQFSEMLLRRQWRYAGNVREHMRAATRSRNQGGMQVKAGTAQQSPQRVPAGACKTILNTCDDRLRRASTARQLALCETGTASSGRQQSGGGRCHPGTMIAKKLSSRKSATG